MIREAAHKALSEKPFKVSTLSDAVNAAAFKLGTRFWVPMISMLKDMKEQKSIFDFG